MLYRHHKGGIYVLLHLARMEASMTDYVAYQALGGAGPVWLRPVAEFFGTVSDGAGGELLRFTPMSEREMP